MINKRMRMMRDKRKVDDARGVADPIAHDLGAGATIVQPIGPNCPVQTNMAGPLANNSVSVRNLHCKSLVTVVS